MTFRRVTFPAIRTALLAGALLAFALSFDEIIVTNFLAGPGVQTLPIWIFSNYSRPNQLPLVNVAAVLVLLALDHPGLRRVAADVGSRSRAGRADLIARAHHLSPSDGAATTTATSATWAATTTIRFDELTHGAPPPAEAGPDRRPTPPGSARSEPADDSVVRRRLAATYPADPGGGVGTRPMYVVGGQERVRVVLEVEQAALAAEPVGRAVVLERRGCSWSCRPPSRRPGRSRWPSSISFRYGYSHGVYVCPRTIAPMDATDLDPIRAGARSPSEAACSAEIGEAIVAPGQMTYGSQAAAASQVFAQQRDLALRDRSDQQLALVDEALARLDAGTFGTCVRCGRPIAAGPARGAAVGRPLHRLPAPRRARPLTRR